MKKIRVNRPIKKIQLGQLTKEIRVKHSLGDKLHGLSLDSMNLDTYVDDDVVLSSTEVEQDVADHVPEPQQEYIEDSEIRDYILLPSPSIEQMRKILRIVARRSLITEEQKS